MHCAFIKDNHVANVAVFASKDEIVAQKIIEEQNYDSCVWVAENETLPNKYDVYDGKTFAPASPEWLFENDIIASLPVFNNPDTLTDHEDPKASSTNN